MIPSYARRSLDLMSVCLKTDAPTDKRQRYTLEALSLQMRLANLASLTCVMYICNMFIC
jgi:hypothetical protein